MYLLKFETKIVQFESLVYFCSFNSLQISVKANWLNSKKNVLEGELKLLVEKKRSLHKHFWSIYREVLSVTWPNFTVVKCNSKISNTYDHIKFRKSIMSWCSIKRLSLKISQYSQEKTCVGVSFLMKMQAVSPVTLLKRDSTTGVFLWILRNFY